MKLRTLILSLFLFFIFNLQFSILYSQPIQQWAIFYPPQISCQAGANDMVVDDSGNVYVTGYTQCSYGGYCTLKYNSTGVLQWSTYYAPSNGSGRFANSIALDNNSNIFVTGYSYADTSIFDFCTVKYNSSGVQQWVRYFDSGHAIDEAQKVLVDNANNIYVLGYSSYPGFQYTTIKYSNDGRQLWVRTYGNYGPSDMVVDDSCNVYITGPYTLKYDSSGNLKWVDNILHGAGNSIALDLNYNVYVGGDSNYISSGQLDMVTIKYLPSGIRGWTKHYHPDSVYAKYQATSIALDSSGNIFVGGYYSIQGSVNKFCNLKYKNNGDLIWAKKDTSQLYGQNISMAVDKYYNIYMASSFILTNLSYVYFIVKYDSSSFLIWRNIDTSGYGINQIKLDKNLNIFLTGSAHSSSRIYTVKYSQPLGINPSSNYIPNEYYIFQNYPNPFNPNTNIKYNLSQNVFVNIRIYDVLGKEVDNLINKFMGPGTFEISWPENNKYGDNKLSSGIYFYQLIVNNNIIKTKKMVFIK